MRPIDVCHPIELRAPAPRELPDPHRAFARWDAPRRLRLRAAFPGDRTFHDVLERFGGSSLNAGPRAPRLAACETRAWACCSHGAECDRASDIRVATSWFILAPLPPSQELQPGRTSSGRRGGTGRRTPKPPRSPSTPARESRRFVMTGMPSAGRDSSQDPVAITAPVPRPPHRASDAMTAG